MRFATVIPSVLLVALLAISHVVVAESQVKSNVALTSDNIEAEIMYQYFEKREGAEDNTRNGTTIFNLRAPEATTETATAEGAAASTATEATSKGEHGSSTETTATTSSKGEHGSSTETTTTTSSKGEHGSSETTTTGTSDKATKKAKAAGSFATIPIFTRGDLFYLGISVTIFLWCTGKVLDVKMERQEKYAESQIHSI